MKLPETTSYGEFYWVAHENCLDANAVEKKLINRRKDIDLIGGVVDADLSYEYDEFALVSLDNEYYLLQTSGCSCPSPTETWKVNIGPAPLSAIKKHLLEGKYRGYTMPVGVLEYLLNLIDEADSNDK